MGPTVACYEDAGKGVHYGEQRSNDGQHTDHTAPDSLQQFAGDDKIDMNIAAALRSNPYIVDLTERFPKGLCYQRKIYIAIAGIINTIIGVN